MNFRIFAIAAALTTTTTITHAADMELWRLDCGSIKVKDLSTFSDTFDYAGMSRMLTDSCYLIRHDKAYMLWDTGLPASLLGAPQDTDAAMAPTLARTVVDQLGEIGVKPADISIVGISHNHFDHLGQAADFSQARMLIGKGDLDGLRADPPPFGVESALVAPWLTGGGALEPVSGDKDVFGDGSVVMLATPGHTADRLSVLVEDGDATIFLAGDTAYSETLMLSGKVDGVSPKAAVSAATLAATRQFALERPTIYLPTHDPESAARLADRRIVGATGYDSTKLKGAA